MKKLITFLFLINIAFAQDSWVKVVLLTDDYPVETSWYIIDANNDTIAQSQEGMLENTVYEDSVDLLSGNYKVQLKDSYGDGLGASQWGGVDGSFVVENTCQGTLMEAYGNFGSELVQDLFIAPCAPPVFEPCLGVDSTNAYQLCWGSQSAVVFEWWTPVENTGCDVTKLHLSTENGYNFTWPGLWAASNGYNNFAAPVGPGQMPPNWEEEHYMVLEFADSSFSDTIYFMPDPCIPGCTDPTQPTYNPWATVDNGSCAGTVCDTATQHQITMQITFDNWPGETGWTMNSAGVIGQALPGEYNFNDIGKTYTYDFCVQQSGFELILTDAFGDGLAGATSGGSLDGYVVIFDCNGDTIWELTNPDFGDVTYSGLQQGADCFVEPIIAGCTDDDYVEYNYEATEDDSSCVTLHVYGCTDSTFYNYNPNATINDIVPDCDYTLYIGDAAGDGWGNSYLGVYQSGVALGTFTMGPGNLLNDFPLILDSDKPVEVYYFEIGGPQTPPEEVQFQTWHNSFYLVNSLGDTLLAEGTNPFENNGQGALQSFDAPFWTTYTATPYCGDYCEPFTYGCMDSLAVNYDSAVNTEDGSCYYNPGCTSSAYLEYYDQGFVADYDDNSCQTLAIWGCTDSTMYNFSPVANIDNGGCISFVYGCMDPTAFNYDPLATAEDVCIAYLYGCTDPTAFNYNEEANADNGACEPVVFGCTDSTAFNYSLVANTDNGSCLDFVYGCTDPSALNYNALANVEDFSCIDYIYGCTDPMMFNYNPNANTENGSCIPFVYGCTDEDALNYDALANTDDNTCIDYIYGCTNTEAFNYQATANTDDGSCIEYAYGCIDPTMFNYNAEANADDGSCVPYVYGCLDATMWNYCDTCNTDNESCIEYVYGCTDSLALNYNDDANTDNGSCIYPLPGCTDPTALNYNIDANVSDSSCYYSAGCAVGDIYTLPNECFAWVIEVDEYCCNISWDGGCVDLYQYCQDGWSGPTDIIEIRYGLFTYPNPTSDYIYVNSRLKVDITVINMLGDIVISKKKVNTLDVFKLAPGVYNVLIEHENIKVNKKIIKQ